MPLARSAALAHHDRALEQLALGKDEVEPAKLDQVAAVERADHDRSLRKGVEHGLERAARQLPAFIVVAEGDDLGGLGAGRPQQVEPQPVAIIDLGPELLRQLDLARLLVDDRDADALGHAASARRSGRNGRSRRRSRWSRATARARRARRAALLAPLEPVGEAHQERRRRHRQGHDGAEQRGRLGRDQARRGRLGEQHEAELARLAEQQPEPEAARPASC